MKWICISFAQRSHKYFPVLCGFAENRTEQNSKFKRIIQRYQTRHLINRSQKKSITHQAVAAIGRGIEACRKPGTTVAAPMVSLMSSPTWSFTARHSATKSVNISIVSSGPPALSGWNCTPQTRFPESAVDLMPSTDESLQLMKKGSQPCGKGSWSFRAYW